MCVIKEWFVVNPSFLHISCVVLEVFVGCLDNFYSITLPGVSIANDIHQQKLNIHNLEDGSFYLNTAISHIFLIYSKN